MYNIHEIIGILIFYVLLYYLYLFFRKIKLSLFSYLGIIFFMSFSFVVFFYIVDVYKVPKFIYDKKLQKDCCINREEYHNVIFKYIWKWGLLYIPFIAFFFYLIDYRNKHFPGISNIKINFIVFSILYFSSTFCSGFASYFIHRAFHTSYLFQFHKGHHEYISPVTASATDGHPLEIFFWNVFPTFAFPLLVGLNVHLVYVLGIISTVISTLVHSGYRLVEYEDMDIGHHDLHHERMKCNYSSPFVDKVFGTFMYREPDKVYARFDKSEKELTGSHNVFCENKQP